MRLKLISDGTSHGTKIVDAATGEMVDDVMEITFKISVGGESEITVVCRGVEADVEGDVKEG